MPPLPERSCPQVFWGDRLRGTKTASLTASGGYSAFTPLSPGSRGKSNEGIRKRLGAIPRLVPWWFVPATGPLPDGNRIQVPGPWCNMVQRAVGTMAL